MLRVFGPLDNEVGQTKHRQVAGRLRLMRGLLD